VEEFGRVNMAVASESGNAGLFARVGPQSLMSIATVGMAAAALVVSILIVVTGVGLHTAVSNGTAGANGAAGASGASGAAGAAGGAGAGTTWGTLNITFSIAGKGLTITSASCAAEGHGAYACELSVASAANVTEKITGLSYPENPNVYYAGADPTIGWIIFPPGTTTNFTLWFQAVQVSGNSNVPVTLLVNDATSSD
jgi:hypothetical protein